MLELLETLGKRLDLRTLIGDELPDGLDVGVAVAGLFDVRGERLDTGVELLYAGAEVLDGAREVSVVVTGRNLKAGTLTDEMRMRMGCGRNNGVVMNVGTAFKVPASELVRAIGKFLRLVPGWGTSVAAGRSAGAASLATWVSRSIALNRSRRRSSGVFARCVGFEYVS